MLIVLLLQELENPFSHFSVAFKKPEDQKINVLIVKEKKGKVKID
jgi:hypothetical protein